MQRLTPSAAHASNGYSVEVQGENQPNVPNDQHKSISNTVFLEQGYSLQGPGRQTKYDISKQLSRRSEIVPCSHTGHARNMTFQFSHRRHWRCTVWWLSITVALEESSGGSERQARGWIRHTCGSPGDGGGETGSRGIRGNVVDSGSNFGLDWPEGSFLGGESGQGPPCSR